MGEKVKKRNIKDIMSSFKIIKTKLVSLHEKNVSA